VPPPLQHAWYRDRSNGSGHNARRPTVRAAAILNADAKVLGGVTEFMKVAALAQAHDLDVAPHGSQDIHVHLVSAIANGLILEYYRDSVDPMWGKMYHHTLGVNDDGTVSPPNVPGHGAEPNYEALEPFRVRSEQLVAA
jgi:L-alanine-DL-glutamate epimerase-like enolase superfamily enzyme